MKEYMDIAIELSRENLEKEEGGPFGACIVKDGKIIGKGKNEVLKGKDPTLHAEIVAIRNACQTIQSHDLSNCELYTSCFPCPMCLSAIIWSNIKTVYYGNTKEDAEKIGFRDNYIYDYIKNNHQDERILKLTSMNHQEAIRVFEEFEMKENHKLY